MNHEEIRAKIAEAIAEGEATATAQQLPSEVFAALRERGLALDAAAQGNALPVMDLAVAYRDLINDCYAAGNCFLAAGFERRAKELFAENPEALEAVEIDRQPPRLRQNPFDSSPEWEAILPEVEDKIFLKIGRRQGMGFCHLYWHTKREILLADYGIEWLSPKDLNPHVMFD